MAGLNSAQQAAVDHDDGPILVLAGAGSGKTRVITHRIARLVQERRVKPEAILAVSFTNKASEEMGERMAALIGRERASKLWLSTFHSFGVRFLGEEGRTILGETGDGRGRFVIFDQADSIGLVREIIKREGLGDRKLDLWSVQARISIWKNKMVAPDQVRESQIEYDELAREVYPHYEAGLRSMRAFDFDDLVVAPARLLGQREDVRDKWRKRFRYVLVDEFQDTNHCQLELVRLLGNDDRNVCVVGDDDQSIYGWRGAEVGNILDFESHFPGAKIVKLEENYRSKAPILGVANAAIQRAQRKRHDKILRATQGGGAKVGMVTTNDADTEAKFVAQEIKRLRADGYHPGRCAVLYRGNLQARLIEEELRVEGIDYQLFGGTKFFDRKEVKDAVAYLRVVVNPRDELSLRRILNYPTRFIGDTTIARAERYCLAKSLPFAKGVFQLGDIPDVPDAARRGVELLRSALEDARQSMDTGAKLSVTARELFDRVGLRRELQEGKTEDVRRRWLDIEHLIGSIERYEKTEVSERPSLAVFLQRITIKFGEEEGPSGDKVTLSSLHASKGLEWPVVFLIGLNEGTLPHARTTDPKVSEAAPTDVEEERRLFYVGVTRARERLYLCRPRQRSMRGKVIAMTPSRFLEGLPEELIEEIERDDASPVAHDEAEEFSAALLARLRGA